MAQDSPNKSTPAAGLPDEQQMERITDFFHEAGHLRHTPRSGYAFLGSGSENVAEHSYRTSVIGYTLAKLAGADAARVTFLCLFHDLHEARTGDFNYVNHRYDTCRDRDALQDAVDGTGLEQDILEGWDELQERRSLEARLAHDADQLDLICNLKAELDKGNKFAADWLESAVKRLRRPRPCARSSCVRTITAGGTAAWTKNGGWTASEPVPVLSGNSPFPITTTARSPWRPGCFFVTEPNALPSLPRSPQAGQDAPGKEGPADRELLTCARGEAEGLRKSRVRR